MISPRDPLDVTLELAARARFEIVDLRTRFSSEHVDAFASYPRCLYWAAHTTAGLLDRSLVVEGTFNALTRRVAVTTACEAPED